MQSFLRHKTTMINPHVLAKQDGITVNTCVQEAGEFMITFPFAYHAGFNHGFNCAESVNFAQPDWIDYGRKASRCRCTTGTATIDMSIFIARYELFQELGPTAILTDDLVLARVQQNKLEKKDDQTNKRKRPRENIPLTSSNHQTKRRRTLPHTSDSSANSLLSPTDSDVKFTFSKPINRTLSSPSRFVDCEDENEKKEERCRDECFKENKSRIIHSKRTRQTGNINSDGSSSSGQQRIVQPRSVMSCTLLGPHKILISVKKAINV